MKSEPQALVFWSALLAVMGFALWSLPSIGHPLGSDWGHYFTAAEFIWDPTDSVAYPDFRKPWFGWILGGLGQGVGYFAAGQLIGKVSLLVMIGAAALLGAALADRWAGLVAAGTITMMPLVMDGVLWVNHYPLLGAAVGLSFAASAAAARWAGTGWVLLAGLSAGACLALDFRGGVAVPVALVLVVLGAQGLGLRKGIGRLVLVLGMMAGPLTHEIWLQRTFDVPQLRVEEQLKVQRKGTLEQIGQGTVGDEALRRACEDEVLARFDVLAPWTPCGAALRASSMDRLASMKLIPSAMLLLIGLLSAIPMRWSRRGRLRSALTPGVVFLVPVTSVAAGMGWVTYFDRYVLPFACLMAVFVPVGLSRLMTALSSRRWSRVVAAVAAGIFAALVWPGLGARALDSPEDVRSSEYHAGVFAGWAATALEGGDGVIDCAGLAVDSLLLPTRIDYVRYPPGDAECVELLKKPQPRQGRTYLITMHRDLPNNASPIDLPFNAAAVQAEGWNEVQTGMALDGFRLWVLK